MEEFLVDDKWKDVITRDVARMSFSELDWEKRDNFRTGISWHIPTESLVELIKCYSPVVSVGAGLAYTESIALEKGADIIATDISPDSLNKWCRGDYRMLVERKESVEAVKSYNDRNVFIAWPPYDNPMAFETAKAMEVGRVLIYVGESGGGCTGDGDFFNYLYENFEEIEISAAIPSWSGIYDNVYVYRKVKC
jgi:hypothetical protein